MTVGRTAVALVGKRRSDGSRAAVVTLEGKDVSVKVINNITASKDDTFADSVYTEIVYRDAIESFVLDSDDSCHFYILARPPYWDKGEPVDVPGEMTRIYARDDLGNLLFPFFDDNGLKPQYYKVIISNGVVGLDYGVDFCGKNCDEYFEYEARPISYALPRRFSK